MMNQSRRNFARKPRNRGAGKQSQDLAPLLRDIKESLLQQQNSSTPDVRDVQIPRVRRNQVYTVVTNNSGQIATTNIESDVSLTFALSNVANAASYANVFDQYRLVGVRISFMPASVSGGGAPVQFPIYTAIDYDDSATTPISSLLQYDTLKVGSSDAYFERSLTPQVSFPVYSGSAFTNFASASKRTWLDAANTGTPYYGVKIGIPATTAVYYVSYVTELTLQFRNTR